MRGQPWVAYERPAEASRAAAKPREFASVYDEQVWRVYGFFGYRVGSRDEAEELTRRTFVRALRSWARYDPSRGTTLTWLLAIARKELGAHDRRVGRATRRAAGSREDPRRGPVGEAALGVSPELERALDALPERHREVVALRYGGDLNGAEIGELTGFSLPEVQAVLSRALRRLGSEL